MIPKVLRSKTTFACACSTVAHAACWSRWPSALALRGAAVCFIVP